MRKIVITLCILLPVLALANPRAMLDRNGKTVAISPDYSVAVGVEKLYTYTATSPDTMTITGASDSSYTCYWQNWGAGQSITFEVALEVSDSTAAYVIEVQSVNQTTGVTSAKFAKKSWIELSGTGQANQKESNTIVTNTSTFTTTTPVYIWGAGGTYFRLLIYSTAAQTGTLNIVPTLHRVN